MSDWAASYRRMIEPHETVVLRRGAVTATVRARVTDYRPAELIGAIQQGDRRIIVLAEDVVAAGFPLPFKTAGGDQAIVRGRPTSIKAVDDTTRSDRGVTIAYELTVRG